MPKPQILKVGDKVEVKSSYFKSSGYIPPYKERIGIIIQIYDATWPFTINRNGSSRIEIYNRKELRKVK